MTTPMTTVVLFHSGLGLRPHLARWRSMLTAAGHEVHTPDLYDGEVFDDLERGVAKRDALGIPELSRRASAAVESLPTDVVYAGFSMGAGAAQALALTRPGARGLILMHGALPLAAFGVDRWPGGLRVQFHATRDDPWVDRSVVDALAATGGPEVFERFEYPGDAHLFADVDHEDSEPAFAGAMSQRVLAFLGRLDAESATR